MKTPDEIAHLDRTSNGVPFDWWYVSWKGAAFCLYPTQGTHSQHDVNEAKAHLHWERDVVGRIGVQWT